MHLPSPGKPNFVLSPEDSRSVVDNPLLSGQDARTWNTQGWKTIVAPYQKPDLWRSVWQIVNSFGLYALLWYLIYRSLTVSYWISAALVLLAIGCLARIFIIQHDCGHGSFFKSRMANHIVGSIAGVLTFTPYFLWRWEHAVHHSTAGNLDRRGLGDIWTWTVSEYRSASQRDRIQYRVCRHPIMLFMVLPFLVFFIRQRFQWVKAGRREQFSVYGTNLGILVIAVAISSVWGWKTYLAIQLAVMGGLASIGVWLFFVQHQFENVYWERQGVWEYSTAALNGSSFYKLPRILQWFTGNIGFHHIHHLSPSIPNYNLQKCQNSEVIFKSVKPVTILSSLKALNFHLFDEQNRRLISFHEVDQMAARNNLARTPKS